MISKEQIISDIQREAGKLNNEGKTITRDLFFSKVKYSKSALEKLRIKWTDIIKEAKITNTSQFGRPKGVRPPSRQRPKGEKTVKVKCQNECGRTLKSPLDHKGIPTMRFCNSCKAEWTTGVDWSYHTD